MPFERLPGVEALVWVPEEPGPGRRKYDCPDCYACQMCSDERCRVCRADQAAGKKITACRKRGGKTHCRRR